MRHPIATASILLLLAGCDRMDDTREVDQMDYARVDAMLRTCPTIRPTVVGALSDTRIDGGEMRTIYKTFGRAYARRAKAETRATTARAAGLKPDPRLPPACSTNDPKGNGMLLEDAAKWGMEFADR